MRYNTIEQVEDMLEVYRILFEIEGDKGLILDVIFLCAENNLPLPSWTAQAFMNAYNKTKYCYENKSWDDVFGRPHPKGTQLGAKQKLNFLRREVWQRSNLLKRRNPEIPIDDGFFEEIGEEIGVCKTVASEAYYSMKKFLKKDESS